MKDLLATIRLDTYTRIVSAAVLIFCLIISTMSILRFEQFLSGKLDLGNMVQTIWNTSQGRVFEFTDPYSTETTSRLGTHADFFLIVLTPLYILFPSAWTLLILQAVILGVGGFIVYAIARQVVKNKLYSLCFALLYLLNPSVIRTSIYDFHAVVLATTFLLAAWYCIIQKKWWWFVFWGILTGLTKEQVWIPVGLMSIYYAWKQKEYVKGIGFGILCFLLSVFLIAYAIPHAHQAPHFVLNNYTDYGEGTNGVITGILTHPIQVLQSLADTERLGFLWQIFSPLSIFTLFAPFFLIFMGPELLGYLISENINMHQLYYQYTATLTPFVFISAIYGFRFIEQKIPAKMYKQVLLFALFLVGFFYSYRYSPFPYSREPQVDMFASFSPEKQAMRAYLSLIPQTASVSATNNLGAHLANREHIYIYPLGYDIADYVVLDKAKIDTHAQEYIQLITDPSLATAFENEKYLIYRRVLQ